MTDKAQAIIDALTVNGVQLSQDELDGIKRAFGVRGAYKGYLKRNKPGRGDALAEGAWLALQPNVYKTSISAIMMLVGEGRELYGKLSKFKYSPSLDKDMEALKKMGAW